VAAGERRGPRPAGASHSATEATEGIAKYLRTSRQLTVRYPPDDARSITGMSDSIFLVGDDGALTEVVSTAYEAEADLQSCWLTTFTSCQERRSTRTTRAAGC
jgi:hypothetical protein